MIEWWTEMWSFGQGRSRVYCGVAETDEGFAVDVFYGDTCLESFEKPTRGEAVRAAGELRRQYEDPPTLTSAARVAMRDFAVHASIPAGFGASRASGMSRQ
jgi:hypothetical protein